MIVQLSPFTMQQKHPGIVHRIKQAYNVGGCSEANRSEGKEKDGLVL